MDWKWWIGTAVGISAMIAAWLSVPDDFCQRYLWCRSVVNIPNCVTYDPTRTTCLRCEFQIAEKDAGQVWHAERCTPMPKDQRVKVRFVGSYEASRNAGSDCWLAEILRGADGKALRRVDHTNVAGCEVDIDRASDFVVPELPGQATGAIRIDQCQWGGDAGRTCKLAGYLSIFTEGAGR